jgi:hypothetical protein
MYLRLSGIAAIFSLPKSLRFILLIWVLLLILVTFIGFCLRFSICICWLVTIFTKFLTCSDKLISSIGLFYKFLWWLFPDEWLNLRHKIHNQMFYHLKRRSYNSSINKSLSKSFINSYIFPFVKCDFNCDFVLNSWSHLYIQIPFIILILYKL